MKKAQKYIGVKPDGENFHLLAQFVDKSTKSEWAIYEDVLSSDRWWLYKVISLKPVVRKANYSMAYDPKTKRLTGKDLPIMAKHQRSLLDVFMRSVRLEPKYFGSSHSENIAAMVKAEIN